MSTRVLETLINLYVEDVEAITRWYTRHFGFQETFRFPRQGAPAHIEGRLADLQLGFVDMHDDAHQFDFSGGQPDSQLVLWVEDADQAYREAVQGGARGLGEPHDFLNGLRWSMVADPEGHHVQIVSRRRAGEPASGTEPADR